MYVFKALDSEFTENATMHVLLDKEDIIKYSANYKKNLNISQNCRGKYSEKLFGDAKQSAKDVLKKNSIKINSISFSLNTVCLNTAFA